MALSGSAGGSGNGENRNLAPAIGTGLAEESHTGTTSSAVSGGSIVIRNPAGQKQDIADLSRDTADAHHGVDVNGDVQKVRDNLAVQSEGAALATSALDAYGKYAEQKARESNAALGAKLASEGKLQGDTPQEQEAFLKTQPGYQNTEYGPGSAFWTKGSAAAGLLAGALGGNLKAGAAAGAAPLLATLVKEQKDPTARAALHGIVAAALTQLSGGSSADGLKAGAIGAITASAMTDHLVSALYGDKKSSDLTAEEKRLVSSLVSIAGGLAGAAVTDGSVSMAAMASETAKVEVENNSLSKDKPNIFDINPMLKIGIEDADGELLKGGGGIAKGGGRAVSSLEGAKLKEYYRQAEKYGQAGVKELENGNYRFYGDMTPSRTTGEMAGARLVREWDPKTGQTRTWYETLDHAGNIRSVAPKPVTNDKNHHIFDADGNYQGRR
ncbi:VENN motif pre-toxin domain-containing protein [Enterobacter asburiae]|uniref:VENN motif pre-toxin domain-containing protein n=1 Tax=Enterobacter cloacae complex TaxID=354276 RepID=UPI0035654506